MKLRLVRDDGTPALIDDLLKATPETCIEIDGVRCYVTTFEGPDCEAEPWSASVPTETLTIGLEYANRERVAGAVTRRHKSALVQEWDCPFARRRRQRAKEAVAR